MEYAVPGTTHYGYGTCVSTRDLMMSTILTAIQKLDQGSKRVHGDELVAFPSAPHISTEWNAMHFQIIGSGNRGNGCRGKAKRLCVTEPEIAKGCPVPEYEVSVNGVDCDFR